MTNKSDKYFTLNNKLMNYMTFQVLEKIRNINSAVEEPMEDGEDRGPATPKRKDILHPFRILLALETYRRCKLQSEPLIEHS